ncbi:chaperonin 10-like protein [Zychaea mexicana]|uniref:chaperonin 10-like protein n=1 Tax=Zychaea mexicana TaxID=64656 RepID=UPI0022FF069B|nr:chaperonin 10-like protein [Zychaea mexicana]KAI9493956.1 chaperonin 10-like protein [Zychaea mexicana]
MTLPQDEINQCVVLREKHNIVLENRPIPELGLGDVLINVKATGICGSDIHYWLHGGIGDFQLKAPMILGHESAGIVADVGPGVKHLKVGDRVALEPGVACRLCDQCKSGRYNLCPEMSFAATPPIDGTLCNYYKHAADFCFKLPDHVSLEEGALIEPLSVGIHSARRANIKSGDRVIVFGAGPVGLLCAAAAKAAGAGHVTIADLVPSRLEFAKTYYTDSQVLLQRPNAGEPNMEYSRRMTQEILKTEELADAVIDCTGAETCVQMSVLLSKNGGSVVLVGMGGSVQALPISEISSREVDIKGIFRYCNTYATAVKMLASGIIDVKPLITHSYPLSDSVEAFKHVKEGRDGAIKVQIIG